MFWLFLVYFLLNQFEHIGGKSMENVGCGAEHNRPAAAAGMIIALSVLGDIRFHWQKYLHPFKEYEQNRCDVMLVTACS